METLVMAFSWQSATVVGHPQWGVFINQETTSMKMLAITATLGLAALLAGCNTQATTASPGAIDTPACCKDKSKCADPAACADKKKAAGCDKAKAAGGCPKAAAAAAAANKAGGTPPCCASKKAK